MKKNKEILSKEFVKNYIYTVLTESPIGFAGFVFVPVVEKTEEFDKVIAGFIIKDEDFHEDGFTANILFLTTYKNETEVELPEELIEIGFTNKKQKPEFVTHYFTYNRLYKIASGKELAETLTEIAFADLINLMFNQELNTRNMNHLSQKENFKTI